MRFLTRLFRKKDSTSKKPRVMICADCGRPVHKHDRYRIISVVHIDCDDPKMVGQRNLKEALNGNGSEEGAGPDGSGMAESPQPSFGDTEAVR